MTIQETFQGFYDFKIARTTKPEGSDKPIPTSIEFEYVNPAISVDSGNRYKKHNIIGGPVVRQRVGQKPKEIDVAGVCKQSNARELDKLRNTKTAAMQSSRFESNSVTVQIVSVSTEPMEDGGAVDIASNSAGKPGDNILYSYSITAVEVEK